MELRIHSAPGLYEYLINQIMIYLKDPYEIKSILDLGAGSGAFAKILLNRVGFDEIRNNW